jgi:hypothetical protein
MGHVLLRDAMPKINSRESSSRGVKWARLVDPDNGETRLQALEANNMAI